MKGAWWTLLSFAVNRVMGFAASIVVARVLGPEAYGIYAVAVLVSSGLAIFSDFGLGGAIVVRENLSDSFDRYAFGLMLLSSAALGSIIILVAPLGAALFGEPEATNVIRALGLIFLFSGFGWFYSSISRRELRFKYLFICSVVQSFGAAIGSVIAALMGLGVWAIVIGQAIGSALNIFMLFYLRPRNVSPLFDFKRIRPLFKESSGFFGQSTFAFISQNADNFVVGRVLGPTSLAFYSTGYRIAELPFVAIVNPICQVLFPNLARAHREGKDLRLPLIDSTRIIVAVTLLPSVAFIVLAYPMVLSVYGPSWGPTAHVLTILGFWSVARALQSTLGYFFNAIGLAGLMARIAGILLAATLPFLIAAAHFGNIGWVSLVMTGDIVASLLIFLWLLRTRTHVRVWEFLKPLWRIYLAGVIAAGVTLVAKESAFEGSLYGGLLFDLGVLVASYAIALFLLEPLMKAQAVAEARRLFKRLPRSRNAS